MIASARIHWAPYPFRAGFCITDDTDAADMESVRIVYDFLSSIGLLTTKTVWPFPPTSPCGIPPTPESTLRGITLHDEDYLRYCRELHACGFEIALHGASAGNNLRHSIANAFEVMERNVGGSSTYICHSKNAENIYWEEKSAPNHFLRSMLKLYSRHKCSGEEPTSEYFWGDICREKVDQIRLFRTRNTNTLAANPSMPYFDEAKPLVNAWFSATKRSFRDCTSTEALTRLVRERGVTVLYQYMHRYADKSTGEVQREFRTSAQRLMSTPGILVQPAGVIMDRLRNIQKVFVAYRDDKCWIINAGEREITDLQIELPAGIHPLTEGLRRVDGILIIKSLPAESAQGVRFSGRTDFQGSRCGRLDNSGNAIINFGHGELHVHLDRSTSSIDFHPEFSLHTPRTWSRIGRLEELGLFFEQMSIIVREILFKGRSVSAERFLGGEEILLENHDNW